VICRPCRVAADWVPAGNAYADDLQLRALVREDLHICIGAHSCACQHRTTVADEAARARSARPTTEETTNG
jgi:hypothetical protein